MLLEVRTQAGVFDQAGKGVLLVEGLAQQWCVGAVLALRFGQGGLSGNLAGFELGLARLRLLLLRRVLLNLRCQRRELGSEFGLARELVALRRQLLQAGQLQALAGQTVPMLLG
ncbi:hypothetical protein D3C84_567460 [compost metagenome]